MRNAAQPGLRVVVWNLHGLFANARTHERVRLASARIQEVEPDLVLIQEIWPRRLAITMHGLLGDAFHVIETKVSRIRMQVGGLMAFVAKRSDRLELTGARFDRYEASAPWWRLHEGDGLGKKGIQHLTLETPAGRLGVLHTHVQSGYPGNDHREVRRRQLHQLDHAGELLAAEMPVLAAGDLNTEIYEDIFGEAVGGWTDLACDHRDRLGGSTHIQQGDLPGGWIDHVLAREHPSFSVRARRLELIENSRVDHPFSDHHGLCVDLDFK